MTQGERIMADEIVIDKNAFSNRLSSFYTAWRADKRSGNAMFGGVGSIVILMGKTDEANSFQKNNAMHVRLMCLFFFLFHVLLAFYLADRRIYSSGSLDTSSQRLYWYSLLKWYMWSLQQKKVIKGYRITGSNY